MRESAARDHMSVASFGGSWGSRRPAMTCQWQALGAVGGVGGPRSHASGKLWRQLGESAARDYMPVASFGGSWRNENKQRDLQLIESGLALGDVCQCIGRPTM